MTIEPASEEEAHLMHQLEVAENRRGIIAGVVCVALVSLLAAVIWFAVTQAPADAAVPGKLAGWATIVLGACGLVAVFGVVGIVIGLVAAARHRITCVPCRRA